MKLENSLEFILQKISKASSISKFIKDDIAIFLEQSARQEYRAAKTCFNDAKLSNSPEREIQSGFTLLKLSHERFSELALKMNIIEGLGYLLLKCATLGIINLAPELKRGEIAIETGILLTVFYKQRNELKLMNKCIDRINELFDNYERNYVSVKTISINAGSSDFTRRSAEEDMRKAKSKLNATIKLITSS